MNTWAEMKNVMQQTCHPDELKAIDVKVKQFGIKLKYWSNEDLKAVLVGNKYDTSDAIGAIQEAKTKEEAKRAGEYYAEFKKDRKQLKREIKRRKKRGAWE